VKLIRKTIKKPERALIYDVAEVEMEDAPFHMALDKATDEFVALIQGFVSFSG
jgi:hypothetical protein